MNILMISRGVPSFKHPQWGCFERDQAEALQQLGHNVVVMSLDGRLLFEWRKIGISHYNINNVDYYDSFWFPRFFSKLISYKVDRYCVEKQICHIYRYVEKIHGKPDVILGQFYFNTVQGAILKNKYNIPLVGIEHYSKFNNDTLDVFMKKDAEFAYNNADAVITVSNTLRQRLLYHLNIDSVVINNLVNSIFFDNHVLDKNKSKIFRFIAVGSLLKVKGHDILIEAFAQLLQIKQNVELIIVGEGNMRPVLESIIKKYNISNKVKLVGKKNKDEIIQYLINSDCFVHPSRSENFSVAILEGLAIGLPVVATLCGGVRECINSDNGILVPVEDIDSLANALAQMVDNRHNYDSSLISDDCYARFSSKAIANKIISILKDVTTKE